MASIANDGVRVALLAGIAILAAGCAPSLSTLQPAAVARPGHIQGHLGFDVSIPTGTVTRVIDAAESLATAARNRDLTEDEKKTVYEAGVNLAANPPSPASNLLIAVGVAKRVEVGVRIAGGGWRLGGRVQILEEARSGVDLSVGLGVSRYTFEFPASNLIPILKIDDFTRWTFDLPVLFGISGSYYRLWAGPKFLFSTFDTAVRVDVPFVNTTELASFDGTGVHVAAQGGAALGYKWIFVGLEVTLAQLFGSAQATLFGNSFRSEIGSFIFHPSLALLLDI
jgi:hypothetical protein